MAQWKDGHMGAQLRLVVTVGAMLAGSFALTACNAPNQANESDEPVLYPADDLTTHGLIRLSPSATSTASSSSSAIRSARPSPVWWTPWMPPSAESSPP